jgi:hypothetical protein
MIRKKCCALYELLVLEMEVLVVMSSSRPYTLHLYTNFLPSTL